jgi:hypothetical protein
MNLQWQDARSIAAWQTDWSAIVQSQESFLKTLQDVTILVD